jgi:hypothetical protein
MKLKIIQQLGLNKPETATSGFCTCARKIMTPEGKCAICDRAIKIELSNAQAFYDQSQKCVSREENINKITQCVIQNIFSHFESLTSKKNKKQSDRQTVALRKIFREKIQEEIFKFIQAVQKAGL